MASSSDLQRSWVEPQILIFKDSLSDSEIARFGIHSFLHLCLVRLDIFSVYLFDLWVSKVEERATEITLGGKGNYY